MRQVSRASTASLGSPPVREALLRDAALAHARASGAELIENVTTRVLDSALAIQPLDHSRLPK